MRKKSLTKDERKIQIITWFAIRIQHDNDDYASAYEIAGGLGMSPSTHLNKIVKELVGEKRLESATLERSGRWTGRGYRLQRGTFERPQPVQIPIKFHSRGIAQMELL
jgi:hypothetical protein